jgi:phage-related protein
LSLEYSSSRNYSKYDFVYFDPKKYSEHDGEKNKIDNFWFAKEYISAANNQKFDTTKWTKIFNHDSKLPFNFQNKYDFYQMDYKNSFLQNIKYKENANVLKKFEFKIENISDVQCKSILFFLEKKCGYRRFIYKFPFALSGYKVFVCIDWNHVFKYYDCNDITATFVEDPSLSSNFFKFIDSDYYSDNQVRNPYPKLLTSL